MLHHKVHKKFKWTITLTAVSVAGFLAGFLIIFFVTPAEVPKQTPQVHVEITPTKEELPKVVQSPVKKPVPAKVFECPTPRKTYADETYLNVGQEVPLLEASYIPDNLVIIDKKYATTSLCIKEEANDALESMIKSAKKDTRNILVSSAFRSYDTQKAILAREKKDKNKNADIAVAKPGYSEHQLGVAVDLTSTSIRGESAAHVFGDTLEYIWLAAHAYEYGFIESYPEGKESITGYMYEPWHYRYVGIDNAKLIHDSGQTVNEFLTELQKKP